MPSQLTAEQVSVLRGIVGKRVAAVDYVVLRDLAAKGLIEVTPVLTKAGHSALSEHEREG